MWELRASADVTVSLHVSHHVSSQVNTEDSYGSQRQRDVHDDEEEEGSDFWNVACQSVGDGFLQVIKYQTS